MFAILASCTDSVTTPVPIGTEASDTTVAFQRGSAHAFIYAPGDGMKAIPSLQGTSQSWATGINDNGIVVGYAMIAGVQHGFAWSKTAGITDIGSLATRASFVHPTAINANGQAVGFSTIESGRVHAFRWTKETGMVDLGLPPDAINAAAWGINRNGDVVGYVSDINDRTRPVRWNADGGIVDLGPASDSVAVIATGINDARATSGTSWIVGGPFDGNANGAMAWFGGPRLDIATCATFDCFVEANAINQDAEVVGESNDRAYRWSMFTGLVVLAPGTPSVATAINDISQVCGSEYVDFGEVAAIWTGSAQPVMLGALKGQTFSRATGINNKGQAVGYSY